MGVGKGDPTPERLGRVELEWGGVDSVDDASGVGDGENDCVFVPLPPQALTTSSANAAPIAAAVRRRPI